VGLKIMILLLGDGLFNIFNQKVLSVQYLNHRVLPYAIIKSPSGKREGFYHSPKGQYIIALGNAHCKNKTFHLKFPMQYNAYHLGCPLPDKILINHYWIMAIQFSER